MRFHSRTTSEPEINLIAFIDVLLVIVIFLMLSTTWSRMTEINLTLPSANVQKETPRTQLLVLSITAKGAYLINKTPVSSTGVTALARALAAYSQPETTLVISADAMASHQAVISAMEAARQSGLSRITFATQTGEGKGP